jgi:hypothetical protein
MNTLIAALISSGHCRRIALRANGVRGHNNGWLSEYVASQRGWIQFASTVDSLERVLLRVASDSWDNHHQWAPQLGTSFPLFDDYARGSI